MENIIEVKKEIVVVCSVCNKIKSGEYWVKNNSINVYTHGNISHGLCPECTDVYLSKIENIKARVQL